MRNFATSFTALTFFVVALSGVMLFFHLFDASVKELHELVGLGFVGVTLLHIYVNFSAMKRYFTKPIFIVGVALLSVVSIGLTTQPKESPKKMLIEALLHAPLKHSLAILHGDAEHAKMRLKLADIEIDNAKNILEIAKNNKLSPFKVIDILGYKEGR